MKYLQTLKKHASTVVDLLNAIGILVLFFIKYAIKIQFPI